MATRQERISSIEEKIAALQKQKQQLRNSLSKEERKLRTRRLIQLGAVVEKYVGQVTPEQLADKLKDIFPVQNKEQGL